MKKSPFVLGCGASPSSATTLRFQSHQHAGSGDGESAGASFVHMYGGGDASSVAGSLVPLPGQQQQSPQVHYRTEAGPVLQVPQRFVPQPPVSASAARDGIFRQNSPTFLAQQQRQFLPAVGVGSSAAVVQPSPSRSLGHNSEVATPQSADGGYDDSTVRRARVMVSSNAAATSVGLEPTGHHHQPAPVSQHQQAAPAVGSLKVEDALSYLDQVKVQFSNKPQVYSDFLDIMKEFKSQGIDTPGVISRVSKLFRGRPALIVGFNTFLPQGYRIDIEGDVIKVSTPSGQQQVISTLERPAVVSTAAPTVASPHVFTSAGRQQLSAAAGGQQKVAERHAAPVTPYSTAAPAVYSGPQAAKMEFNQAISYVNKIKERFHHRPDIYKSFLEILHSYQKEQREPTKSSKRLTEAEVYQSVSELFHDEPDLLREFSQFLPEATGGEVLPAGVVFPSFGGQLPAPPPPSASQMVAPPPARVKTASPPATKRTLTPPNDRTAQATFMSSPAKIPKIELTYEVPLSEALKYGTIDEFQFFDKVKRTLRSDDVYRNFLRCLLLFNHDLLTRTELIEMIQPFLSGHAELLKWFKDFVATGSKEESRAASATFERHSSYKTVQQEEEGISSDLAMEIDYATCKQLGVSYRALPDSYVRPKCSGRTALCDEVLNDTWVSFPSWASEDSCVSSKKTAYEEFVYRTEDERFELDIVIEVNNSAIRSLEALRRRMDKLKSAEAEKFHLQADDGRFGHSSAAIMARALRRIYGGKTADIVEGLRKNPRVAVPLVINRLKKKDEEWRDAQKALNKVWREQDERHYLKSLDHQAAAFKQNDARQLRARHLVNQIETLYDQRREKTEPAAAGGPHMRHSYPKFDSGGAGVIRDVCDLLIHHVKRQAFSNYEKSRMKRIINRTLMQLFDLVTQPLSDGEDEEEVVKAEPTSSSCLARNGGRRSKNGNRPTTTETKGSNAVERDKRNDDKPSSRYSLFFGTNAWYTFFHHHQLICERLGKLRQLASPPNATSQDAESTVNPVSQTLKCAQKAACRPNEQYAYLIEKVKNLLDNHIDSVQFEDSIRSIFTINAYLAFTMDKLVQNMVRQVIRVARVVQLQSIVGDEASSKCLEVYERLKKEGGAGGLMLSRADVLNRKQLEYQREAEKLMDNQNCYMFHFLNETRDVTVELLDAGSSSDDCASSNGGTTTSRTKETTPSLPPIMSNPHRADAGRKPLYLQRCARLVKRRLLREALKKASCWRAAEATAVPGQNDESLCSVLVRGCELNFSTSSKKFQYVEESGDFVYRPNSTAVQQRSRTCSNKRKSQFARWLSKAHKAR